MTKNFSFKSLKVEHGINDKLTVGKTVVALPKDVKGTFGYKIQRSEPYLELEHGRWDLKYNVKTKDCEGRLKFKTDFGKLKIKQKVAKSDFKNATVSPIVELETTMVTKENYKDKLELSYDFGKKVAAVAETIKIKDKHHIKVKADSNVQAFEDLSLEAKSNINKSILNDVGLEYTKKNGPVLKAELGPFEGAELDLDYYLNSKKLVASLEYTKDRTVFEVSTSVNTGSGGMKPSTKVGMKYTF
eukprot:TRINITY_DN987_c0_g1_i2.p2 TRINITY_DN987_c0_g1~~TRINITY_DN987_c0_g1_i2.p2  ORF type:complete len:244 (+),score=38.15 TRINITY_DN987_c0_g1_i2:169-900(+)